MEMAKDFQKDCPNVKVTIAQNAADYTVLLNHIELGLLLRDNQVQVADRNGDMLVLHEGNGIKSGSIRGSVKIACRMIMEDWNAKDQPPPVPPAEPPNSAPSIDPATPELAPQTVTQSTTQRVINDAPAIQTAANLPTEARVPAAPRTVATVTAASATPNASAISAATADASDGSIGASSDEKPTVRHDGVTLSQVAVGGPADKAGIMAGDVLLAIDDHYIYTVDEMNAELRRHSVGEHVSIRYRRFRLTNTIVLILEPAQ